MSLVGIGLYCEVTINMRKIPICSVEELKNILTTFYGIDFGGIRDGLLDEYETVTIIDKNEIERLRYRNQKYDFLYDDIIKCMECEVLPYQFVLYVG